MEQMVIRNLADGTKDKMRRRAQAHHRSMEAEARTILEEALRDEQATIVDMLRAPDGIELEVDRLGIGRRPVDL